MHVDLGVLQMELEGRPDGARPHGFTSYFEYLKQQSVLSRRSKQSFKLNEEQCIEADREFVQYYHRRICWLALRNYDRAVADADHNLHFMNFVKEHSPNDEYTLSHEQYRGFVIFHRTQAAAAWALEKNDPEAAIDAVHQGLSQIHEFFAEHGVEDRMDEDAMVQQLRKIQQQVRDLHQIESTTRELLEKAVESEDYETAALLRDRIRERGHE